MNRRIRAFMLLALTTGGLAACSDGPTAPGDGLPEVGDTDLAVSVEMELQVVGDDVLAEVAIEDVALSMDATAVGTGTPFADARACFQDARELLRAGNAEAAKEKAVECRRALVQALIDARGEEVVDELFGRVESLLERIDEADDEFERLSDLGSRVQELRDEAYALRGDGDLVGAGERLLLALQMADRMRHRHHDFVRHPMNHARLALARAVEAIQLANELIPEPTFKQERVLFRAEELLRRARFAFDHGAFRRAVVLAHRAEARALWAVLECERPTVEDALALLDLAERVILAAEEAIGDGGTPVQQALLQRAKRLKEVGAQAINTWHWRGVGLLWHAAVTAAILLPPPGA